VTAARTPPPDYAYDLHFRQHYALSTSDDPGNAKWKQRSSCGFPGKIMVYSQQSYGLGHKIAGPDISTVRQPPRGSRVQERSLSACHPPIEHAVVDVRHKCLRLGATRPTCRAPVCPRGPAAAAPRASPPGARARIAAPAGEPCACLPRVRRTRCRPVPRRAARIR
jgi:hypothetical protein